MGGHRYLVKAGVEKWENGKKVVFGGGGPKKTDLRVFQKMTFRQTKIHFGKIENGEKSKIVKEWTKRAIGVGKKITINTSNGKISGISQGIDNDGALKLKIGKELNFLGSSISH